MQFAVRLTSQKIVVILVLAVGPLAVDGQDLVPPSQPTITPPTAVEVPSKEVAETPDAGASNRLTTAVSEPEVQAKETDSQTIPPEPPKLAPQLPGAPLQPKPLTQESSTSSPEAPLQPSLPSAVNPAVGKLEPAAQPVHQASAIDPVQSSSTATLTPTAVQPIATSVVEGRVESASFNQPAGKKPRVTGTAGLNLELPRQLLEQFDVSPVDSDLPGRPVTLLEMLRNTRVAYRNDMIQQYWKTYADWALLQNAREYQEWLQQVSRPATGPERILLSAARHEATSQIMAAEIELNVSQQHLQELASMDDAQLPLPQDVPLIKGYQTHYEWFASRNLVPGPLKGIHQRLPRQLKLIAHQAETVRIAKSAMNQTRTSFASGQQHVASVLEAGRLWQTGSRQLIETVTDYNQAIGEYAIAIHREFKSPEQVVAMLIPNSSLPDVQNVAQPARNSNLPIARVADRSFGSPLARSPAEPNRSRDLNPAASSSGASTPAAPLRTAQGGTLGPVPAPPVSSSTSVLESGTPNRRPNLVPLSQTRPPAKQADNGFLPLPANPSGGQPATAPSSNGFQAPPVNRNQANPPTGNNTFGGGSFGGS